MTRRILLPDHSFIKWPVCKSYAEDRLFRQSIMSARERIGLVFLIAGMAIVPIGWIVSHKILLLAGSFLGVGGSLFYTARMRKREEQLTKESTGSGNYGPSMPRDVHNYTGWRTGGRTQPLDTTSSEGGFDGD